MNISIIKNMLTLPETGKDTILRMAYHSAKDLNSRPMSSNHPMFGIFREAMLTDIRLQLNHEVSLSLKTELALAMTSNSKIIGFIIYRHSIESVTACGISYVCVDAKYRKRGVLSALIEKLKSRFSNISLGCSPSLVGLYERFGFEVSESSRTQVEMHFGKNCNVFIIDPNLIFSAPSVNIEKQKLIEKYGEAQANLIVDAFDEETENICNEVASFVENLKLSRQIIYSPAALRE